MWPQVNKDLYFGLGYVNPERFASYAYQLSEILALKPDSVLEIGIGNGLVSRFLMKAGCRVTTLDHDDSLGPDIVASVTGIPCPDACFDVVACFEVLEHLPFETFRQALGEIFRVSRAHALISLPDSGPYCKVYLPRIGKRRYIFDLPIFKMNAHHFDGEHFWQINTEGCGIHRVLETVESVGFVLKKTYRVWEWPEHRMFRLKKGTGHHPTNQYAQQL